MAKAIVTTAIGPRDCGRKTTLEIIARLARGYNQRSVMFGRASDIIRGRMRFYDDLAKDLNKHKHLMDQGLPMPEELTTQACTGWIKAVQESNHDLQHLFLQGFPTNTAERRILNQLFERSNIIHIDVDKGQAFRCSYLQRKDDRNESFKNIFENAWEAYERRVLPMLALDEKIIRVKRADPLTDRIRDIVEKMDVPAPIKTMMRNRLNAPGHPVHDMICRAEGRFII